LEANRVHASKYWIAQQWHRQQIAKFRTSTRAKIQSSIDTALEKANMSGKSSNYVGLESPEFPFVMAVKASINKVLIVDPATTLLVLRIRESCTLFTEMLRDREL
jgi:hypothetical protein